MTNEGKQAGVIRLTLLASGPAAAENEARRAGNEETRQAFAASPRPTLTLATAAKQ